MYQSHQPRFRMAHFHQGPHLAVCAPGALVARRMARRAGSKGDRLFYLPGVTLEIQHAIFLGFDF